MTAEDVAERLSKIRAYKHDPEAAHSLEDQLYLDVLEAIAQGAADAPYIAQLALRASKIDFPRWAA